MKVSVVIPVYNVKPYLERCVKSVLRQTHKDLEIIIVDDGSTDGSNELCDELAVSDERIIVIHQENQGLSAARNVGICRAKGDYLLFLDSDDEWIIDEGLERLIKATSSSTDLVIFKNVDYWEKGRKTFTEDYDTEKLHQLPDAQAVFAHLIRTQRFCMSACFVLIRRTLLIENGVFFPLGYISEDLFWSMHLWQVARTVKVTNLDFYGYHHRQDSLSSTPSLHVYHSYDQIFTYWKEQCNNGCINAQAIRIYLANMWVNRGYGIFGLKEKEKESALQILKAHTDILKYGISSKAKWVRCMVRCIGVSATVEALSCYWRLRNFVLR